MKRCIQLLIAVIAIGAPIASQARLLVDADDLRVTAERDASCVAPVRVVIEADEPHLLSAASPRVQGTFDAARAILEFECGPLPAVEVTGRLRGLTQASYQVEVTPDTGWLLASNSRSPRAAQLPGPTSRFAVRSLTTGIGVDDAMNRARREFASEPRYDAARRELSAARNGDCGDPRRKPLRPGAQCLTARFTDTAQPRLSRLFYTQAVDADQAQSIRRQLIESFGKPTVDRTIQRENTPTLHLAWGEPVTVNRRGQAAERHELTARIRVSENITLVRLNLIEPGHDVADSASDPVHQAQF